MRETRPSLYELAMRGSDMPLSEWAKTPEGQAEGYTLNSDGSVSIDLRKLMATPSYRAIAALIDSALWCWL